MDYVYMVKCCDNTYYTGWTTDPKHRLKTHNLGKGAKYTRPRLPVTLIYLEQLPSKSIALGREIAIKKLTRLEKDRLVSLYQNITKGHPDFTPICWTTPSPDPEKGTLFCWLSGQAIDSVATTSSIHLDLSQYPLKIKPKVKKKAKKKPTDTPKPKATNTKKENL